MTTRATFSDKGKDGIAKTPEWAAKITGIPVETIVQLAKEMGTTKPCFISQGWGPQRQANGEETARAIGHAADSFRSSRLARHEPG